MNTRLDRIRIVIVDDHSVVRMGFRLLLEGAGAEIVAEADCGEAGIGAYDEYRPDVLVMDVSMPGIGGIGALERLRARDPDARVLILSAYNDVQISSRALKAGARGYLSKHASPSELLRAVAAVARGQRYLDPEIAPHLALALLGGVSDPLETLTEKEFAVFLEYAKGNSVADVAATYRLSSSTVGTHLYHVKQKLNASNGAQLALIAVRSGLLDV